MGDVVLVGLVLRGSGEHVDRAPYPMPLDVACVQSVKMVKEAAGMMGFNVVLEAQNHALPSVRLKTILVALEAGVACGFHFSVITDAELDKWAAGAHKGYANSVQHLRPLTPIQRQFAKDEAHARMHMCPGWNYSGAAWQAAQDVLEGYTPYLDSAELLRRVEYEDKLREV